MVEGTYFYPSYLNSIDGVLVNFAYKRFFKVLFSSKEKMFFFCGCVGNGLSMYKIAHRGKIAYIWIFPHPANSGTLLGIVVVV